VKLATLSCDAVESHEAWLRDVVAHCENNITIDFPIIADPSREISVKYGMLDPNITVRLAESLFPLLSTLTCIAAFSRHIHAGSYLADRCTLIMSISTAKRAALTAMQYLTDRSCILAGMYAASTAQSCESSEVATCMPVGCLKLHFCPCRRTRRACR